MSTKLDELDTLIERMLALPLSPGEQEEPPMNQEPPKPTPRPAVPPAPPPMPTPAGWDILHQAPAPPPPAAAPDPYDSTYRIDLPHGDPPVGPGQSVFSAWGVSNDRPAYVAKYGRAANEPKAEAKPEPPEAPAPAPKPEAKSPMPAIEPALPPLPPLPPVPKPQVSPPPAAAVPAPPLMAPEPPMAEEVGSGPLELFDIAACWGLRRFGPPGRFLASAAGKSMLGYSGLLMLLAAVAVAAMAFAGVNPL